MPTFEKTDDSLLMSFMKFSHMFRDMSSTRFSQLNSDTEQFVLYEFQEFSLRGRSPRTNYTTERPPLVGEVSANFY
jgi:hypothetical protein